jgi:hypothetical protein
MLFPLFKVINQTLKKKKNSALMGARGRLEKHQSCRSVGRAGFLWGIKRVPVIEERVYKKYNKSQTEGTWSSLLTGAGQG